MNFKELSNEWLENSHRKDIKEKTYLRYKGIIDKYLIPNLGNKEITSFNKRELYLFINKVRETPSTKNISRSISNSSVNLIISLLKLIFGYAHEYELIYSDPMYRMKRLPTNNNKVRAFTKEEQIKIEKYITKYPKPEDSAILFSLYTGIRIGELLALTWNDINLKTGVLTINKTLYRTKDSNNNWVLKIDVPKTKNSIREIPLPSFLKEYLRLRKKEKKTKVLFVKNDGVTPINDRLLRYRLNSITKKCHIPNLNYHCLRHTFATRAIENKMDIKTLSEILGHSNVAITLNVYAHSFIENKKKQMRKIKKLV